MTDTSVTVPYKMHDPECLVTFQQADKYSLKSNPNLQRNRRSATGDGGGGGRQFHMVSETKTKQEIEIQEIPHLALGP